MTRNKSKYKKNTKKTAKNNENISKKNEENYNYSEFLHNKDRMFVRLSRTLTNTVKDCDIKTYNLLYNGAICNSKNREYLYMYALFIGHFYNRTASTKLMGSICAALDSAFWTRSNKTV